MDTITLAEYGRLGVTQAAFEIVWREHRKDHRALPVVAPKRFWKATHADVEKKHKAEYEKALSQVHPAKPKQVYSHAFEIAFEVETTQKDPTKIYKEDLILALKRRVQALENNEEELRETLDCYDTAEHPS